MALIKFSDYNRLNQAMVTAKDELRVEQEKGDNGLNNKSISISASLSQITAMLDLYDFGRHGAIYIDSGEASLIKRFTPEW